MSTFYGQIDPRWAKMLLGYNTDPTYDLANFGCVVTAWGNMLVAITGDEGYTPAMVNQWMINQGGFLPGSGVFIWQTALGMGHVKAAGTSADLAAVNNFLQAPPNFAILEVRADTRQHFVLAPWVNKIVDSEDGQIKSQSTYPFVNAHLYVSLDPVPAPPPPPTSGSLNAVVEVMIPILNARTQPSITAPVAAKAYAGAIHVDAWQVGDQVTIRAGSASKTDNVWLKTDGGHWISQAGTNSNYGHFPARLTATQKANLYGAELYGSVAKLGTNIFRRKSK